MFVNAFIFTEYVNLILLFLRVDMYYVSLWL